MNDLFESLGALLSSIAQQIGSVLLYPGSSFSIWSLLSAGLIGCVWLKSRLGPKAGIGRVLKSLLPARYLTNPSARLDWMMIIANHSVFPALVSYALFSMPVISAQVSSTLSTLSGGPLLDDTDASLARMVTTLALFLAYEFSYFLDHALSHRIPLLWHFHKVHHAAESLSPVTNFRVHPVDSLVFTNIAILFMGAVGGLCSWLFGSHAAPFKFDGLNIFSVAFVFLLLHLQHSQLWIAASGWLGRFILSPAHHQLHHSQNPAHFNCNFGNSLAIWDRMFGSLIIPQKRMQRLKFGLDDLGYNPHSLAGSVVMPFVDASREIAGQSRPPERKPALQANPLI